MQGSPINGRYLFDQGLNLGAAFFPTVSVGRNLKLLKNAENLDNLGQIFGGFTHFLAGCLPFIPDTTLVPNTIAGTGSFAWSEDSNGGSISVNFGSGRMLTCVVDNTGFTSDMITWADGSQVFAQHYSNGEDVWESITASGDFVQIRDGVLYTNYSFYNLLAAQYLHDFTESSTDVTLGIVPRANNLAGNNALSAVFAGDDAAAGEVGAVLAETDVTSSNCILTGSDNINATGNDLCNIIVGNDGNNVLNGEAGDDILISGAGEDTLIGGSGNDIFVVANSNDVVIEDSGEDNDTVISSVSYVLPANVENLSLTGSNAINGTGNALDNEMVGNYGNNVIDGGAGDDYVDGSEGADTLIGGTGNDTIVVDNAGDIVIENPGEGIDTVVAGISYVLGANVENLMLNGGNSINGTGNELDNSIVGNGGSNVLDGGAGNDYIDGGAGADTMFGGAGNDTFVVDNVGDVVSENPGEGNDTVATSINYTLGATIENIMLIGSENIDGTGNELDNVLIGNDGNNVLNGGAGTDYIDGGHGADTMIGGLGNDTYIVDNSNDTVVENSGEGIDTVWASINYTLGANVENIGLDGSANLNATGNELDNALLGNSGINILDGGAGDDYLDGEDGADTLYGGAGNDTLYGGKAADTLNGGAGNDTYLWGGGAGNDVIYNYTDGGHGQDTVQLGDGLTVDSFNYRANGQDLILLNATTSEMLTISGWFTGTAYQVENFLFADGTSYTGQQIAARVTAVDTTIMMGTAGADYISGVNGRNNTIYGLDGNDNLWAGNLSDILDGGAGNDSLYGNTGSDTYVWGTGYGNDNITAGYKGAHTAATVKFGAGLTVDSLDYLVSGNNLVLKNKATGETLTLNSWYTNLNNQIQTFQFADGTTFTGQEIDSRAITYGTAGNDNLFAKAGRNNILDGGAGSDNLYGNTGSDTYIWGSGYGNDNITAGYGGAHATATVKLGEGLTVDSLDYLVSGNNLVLKNKTTAETLTISGWFSNANNKVQAFQFADGTSFTGQEIDSRAITYGTSGNDYINCINGRNNTVYTLGGSDYIWAGNGNDILDGGAGNDMLYGGTGSDTFIWSQGYGNDIINAGYSGAHGQDTLQFQNLVQADIEFSKNGNNLICTFDQTGENVTLTNWCLGANYQVNTLQFTDGSLTAAQVNQRLGI